MAGNSSFDGIVAFASEKEMKKIWSPIWAGAFPLLAMVKAKKINYNTALMSPEGNSILFPLNYLGPATSARAATNANAFTPITPNATQVFTQAQFYYAKYENALYLTATEKQLIADNAHTTRIPILPGKIQQLVTDFKSIESTDLLGTQNGTGQGGNGQLTGLQYLLSSSNSPGGVSQTTYSKWAAGIVANAGGFYEGLIDKEIHRIRDLGRHAADFCMLSYNSSNDVYGKLYGLIAPTQAIVDQEKEALYGFEVFKYRYLECFQEGRLGDALSGSMVVGSSGTFHMQEKTDQPVQSVQNGTLRLAGTTSDEQMFEHWITWGNDDLACNTLVTGIL